jgi:hypothetical protein
MLAEVQICLYVMLIEQSHIVVYEFNVNATSPKERGRWGIGIVVRDVDDVLVNASCW